MDDDHFDPVTYREWIRQQIPHYDELQERVRSTLHPGATAVGIDVSGGMLDVARARLADFDVTLHVADLLDPLPAATLGAPSALAVHHLDGPNKAALFRRVAGAPGQFAGGLSSVT